MNIRIGNDICLYVNLLGNKNLDAVNVNSIEAFLINTTKWLDLMDEQYRESALMQDEYICRRDLIKYVSRFPVEPHFPGFHPTPYDVCCTGHPCYHQHPIPYIPMYHGYGVSPHTFERGCFGPCAWHTNHPHHIHTPHTWACDDMHDIIDRAGVKYMDMQRQYDRCRFLAPVEATENKNKVKVFFPAQAQLYTGTYKLVIVAKVYEPGYCKDNLRTITIDYENVFTLVNSSDQGVDGNITVHVGTNKLYAEEIRQIRMSSENYTMIVGDELSLGKTDYTGKIYKLIIDLKDGSSVEYNPGDWEFGSVVFNSENPLIINVNQTTGKLTAMPNSEHKQAVIKVYNNQHQEMTSFTVKVVEKGYDYIVFINSDKIEDVHNYIFGSSNQDLEGDFNNDGVVNGQDIQAFINGINSGSTDPKYDINGDGQVNGQDTQALINIVNSDSNDNPSGNSGSGSSSQSTVDISKARMYAYENIFGTRFVNNPSSDNYMWIVSREKIADSNTTLSPIKTSMFDVPLKDWSLDPEHPQIYKYNEEDHLYYHMCPNPLIATTNFSGFDITVEPK